MGFVVTGKNEKTGHNPGSPHYDNRAIDVRTRGKSDVEIQALMDAARARGWAVIDERTRPKGQAVWTRPHIHIHVPRGFKG